MREVVFIKRNSNKWKEYEGILTSREEVDADILTAIFIQITEDLSFARTFYPGSKIIDYLNSLSVKAHSFIYKKQNIPQKQSVLDFWKFELPGLFYKHRQLIILSFLIFAISIFIGVISSKYDNTFVKVILGERYVQMTQSNIERGDPMAVYKNAQQLPMFLGITLNNIKVSFIAFVFGIFFSFGSAYIIFQNGVMVGAFQYFFFTHNLLLRSSLSILLHGVFELSAIVIAGAAGLLLGKSFIIPGTYSRRHSFIVGANEGVKIVIGLVPLFIVAGFIESFITRYTNMNLVLNIFLIISMSFIVIWYVIIYPIKITEKKNHG
ncbi:MAG: stage II sporulation protein M [Ignavibacteria bacterium]|nr:stage II sporulation protein M [Ignavibacteria bacterium]